ncbi:SDR family NAD(P)-dependent oxidoreductase [Nocardia fluminea]|uniref:3alpha(Or 20beta)-hydroxysteroid dehydrogenase n=1 Tax=Nocardia fluminea TaxID=134984 RepID=A0A2N3V5K0_9NOCA|nr:SDR family NAD(P)-dependent oxidoreductase [Nocardia fluminea]PKV76907.1 3alpha(or 20beta)-hydroxysteroid dehydrogenase [Nocardia fluminea]
MTTRTVVVTGAAGGIGRVVAERLAADGYHVVALDRQGSEREFDVTDERQWRALAATFDTPVHGLVNCAGITRRARLDEVTVADMTDAYAVNVLAPLLAIQALTPVMSPGSAIVNIGSIAALTGHYPVAYTTSKWALRGLTHTAALALGEHGIRINIVHPGFIDTPMTESAPAPFRSASIGETALARAGTADEVAGTVAFLLGADSTYLTGAEITVDGGASSHGGVKSISDALRPEPQEHK